MCSLRGIRVEYVVDVVLCNSLLLVQDVMLSGVVSSQLPMTSSLAGMTTLAGKVSSSLTESVLVGLPSLGAPSTAADMAVRVAETAAANGKRDIITLLWLTVKDPLNGYQHWLGFSPQCG